MKIKLFGFALMLSMAAALGACETGTTPSTDATATPGEPADAGAATTPADAATTPEATTTP